LRDTRSYPYLVPLAGRKVLVLDARHLAAQALGGMGRDARSAAPELRLAMKSRDRTLSSYAAGALAMVGLADKAPLARLEEMLTGEKGDLRDWAAKGLGKSGGAAVGILTRALKSDDLGVREAAAVALGHVGEGAADAVPALTAALEDPVHNLR